MGLGISQTWGSDCAGDTGCDEGAWDRPLTQAWGPWKTPRAEMGWTLALVAKKGVRASVSGGGLGLER